MNTPLKIVGDDGSTHSPHPLGSTSDWQLSLTGAIANPSTFTLEELSALAAADQRIERGITCVSSGQLVAQGGPVAFTGLDFSALVAIAAPQGARTVEFISRAGGMVGPRRCRHRTSLSLAECLAPEGAVHLVTQLEDAPLPYAHGGPLRSIPGPHLFFYKGVKWLEEIRFLTEAPEDCRGTWEEHAGYHNRARVALNERFEPVFRRILEVHDIDGRIEDTTEAVAPEDWATAFAEMVSKKDLSRLVAAQLHKAFGKLPTDLRGCRFSEGLFQAKIRGTSLASCDLTGAVLAGGNFSLSIFTNARFSRDGADPADLRGADFEGAFFNKAHLRNADLRGAYLNNATFFSEQDFDRPTDRVLGLDVRGAGGLDLRTAEWLRRGGAIL